MEDGPIERDALVSTRIVIAVCFFLLILAIGMDWLSTSSGVIYSGLSLMTLMEYVENTYGDCSCPPTGTTWRVLSPAFSPGGTLFIAGFVLFPVALILGFVSIFRWKLMLGAGLAGLASSGLWIGYVLIEADDWVGRMEAASPGPSLSVYPQTGVFVALLASLGLIAGYQLSKGDRLEWPH